MVGKHDSILKFQRELKQILVTKGFYEINSYSLVPSDSHIKLGLNDAENEVVKISNPISDELGVLRISMAHSLLSNISFNTKRNNKDFKIFESGKTFHAKALPIVEQPTEKNILAFASIDPQDDFYTFKGVIENLIERFAQKFTIDFSKKPFLHPGISADVKDENGEIVASFGKINPIVANEYEIPENTFYGELDCDKLISLPIKTFKVKKISKFPIVERDLAIVVDENVTVGSLEEVIKQCCGKNYNDVKLFDIYRSEQLGDKKSLAFRIKLLSDEKTLSEEEINKVIDKILRRTNDLYGAVLR